MTNVTTSAPTAPKGARPSPVPRTRMRVSLLLAGGAGLAAALLLIAALLWARYGTGVFFDMMSAGLATCL